jgi:hypothetical protein
VKGRWSIQDKEDQIQRWRIIDRLEENEDLRTRAFESLYISYLRIWVFTIYVITL